MELKKLVGELKVQLNAIQLMAELRLTNMARTFKLKALCERIQRKSSQVCEWVAARNGFPFDVRDGDRFYDPDEVLLWISKNIRSRSKPALQSFANQQPVPIATASVMSNFKNAAIQFRQEPFEEADPADTFPLVEARVETHPMSDVQAECVGMNLAGQLAREYAQPGLVVEVDVEPAGLIVTRAHSDEPDRFSIYKKPRESSAPAAPLETKG